LWYDNINEFLLSLHFTSSTIDPTLYVKDGVLLLLYVDDILIIHVKPNAGKEVKQHLSNKYKMTDLGEAEYAEELVTRAGRAARAQRFLGLLEECPEWLSGMIERLKINENDVRSLVEILNKEGRSTLSTTPPLRPLSAPRLRSSLGTSSRNYPRPTTPASVCFPWVNLVSAVCFPLPLHRQNLSCRQGSLLSALFGRQDPEGTPFVPSCQGCIRERLRGETIQLWTGLVSAAFGLGSI
jgi:hypothetical protein